MPSPRQMALDATQLLDSLPEDRFDRITRLAARTLGTDIALISLIDRNRQWFKSNIGLNATETPRDQAFCDHAIRQPDDVMVVLDATDDARFVDNPLVTDGPNIAFYAGAPLVTSDGHALGTLCVIDPQPRDAFSDMDQQLLRDLAATVMTEIELAQEKQINADLALINDELRHRMGNTYAHISGLIGMMARTDGNKGQFVRRLREKITVLSQTQALLAANRYQSVGLQDLVQTALAPFGIASADTRIHVQAENDFEISPRSAFTLTLMLNELATNAMKHGALADTTGKVEFTWTLDPKPTLSWREIAARPQPIMVPATEEVQGERLGENGFGTKILKTIVPLDFQGEAVFDLTETGLVYSVSALPERLFAVPK